MPILAALGVVTGGIRAVVSDPTRAPRRFFLDSFGHKWSYDKFGNPFRYDGPGNPIIPFGRSFREDRKERAQYNRLLEIYDDFQRRRSDPALGEARYARLQRQVANLAQGSPPSGDQSSQNALPLVLLAVGFGLFFFLRK